MITEEKARAYAENTLVRTISRPAHPLDYLAPYFDSKDIQQAYLTGATEALASQWVSVEERLPDYNATCLIRGKEDDRHWWTHFAWFDGENFYDAQTDRLYRPHYWLPIPPLKGGDA